MPWTVKSISGLIFPKRSWIICENPDKERINPKLWYCWISNYSSAGSKIQHKWFRINEHSFFPQHPTRSDRIERQIQEDPQRDSDAERKFIKREACVLFNKDVRRGDDEEWSFLPVASEEMSAFPKFMLLFRCYLWSLKMGNISN